MKGRTQTSPSFHFFQHLSYGSFLFFPLALVLHLARQEFVNEKSKVMKMNRAIMNLYKDNKALQKSNDGLELEVRSCKKEKIAILRGIRGYLNSIRRNEEPKRSHEYHNGPLSDNLDEIKENEPISTSHTLDESDLI
jgi:hypothetical protein